MTTIAMKAAYVGGAATFGAGAVAAYSKVDSLHDAAEANPGGTDWGEGYPVRIESPQERRAANGTLVAIGASLGIGIGVPALVGRIRHPAAVPVAIGAFLLGSGIAGGTIAGIVDWDSFA